MGKTTINWQFVIAILTHNQRVTIKNWNYRWSKIAMEHLPKKASSSMILQLKPAWLVVEPTPLKNMSSSMGRMTSHIWNGKKHVWNHQPTAFLVDCSIAMMVGFCITNRGGYHVWTIHVGLSYGHLGLTNKMGVSKTLQNTIKTNQWGL